jgi:chromosome segregation ATPase
MRDDIAMPCTCETCEYGRIGRNRIAELEASLSAVQRGANAELEARRAAQAEQERVKAACNEIARVLEYKIEALREEKERWRGACQELERVKAERDGWRKVASTTDADLLAERARVARLREALNGLLREEPLVYEGNLEAKLFVTVDALNAARAALADTDAGCTCLMDTNHNCPVHPDTDAGGDS